MSWLRKINLICVVILACYYTETFIFVRTPNAAELMKPFTHIHHTIDKNIQLKSDSDQEIFECLESLYPHLKEFEIYKHKNDIYAQMRLFPNATA